MMFARAIALTVVLLAGGCATPPPPDPAALAGADRAERCVAGFRWADRMVAEAGVGDAEAARIEGFPYLRVSRLIEAVRPEPFAATPATLTWIEHLADLDRAGRAVELRNLPPRDGARLRETLTSLGFGGPVHAALDPCRTFLVTALAESEDRWPALVRAARVPDHYSLRDRALGLYPLTAVGVAAGYKLFTADQIASFGADPYATGRDGSVLHAPPSAWTADPGAVLARIERDELGLARPTAEQLARLARAAAPVFVVETAGDADRPGHPVVDPAGGPVLVDRDRPTLFARLAHTTFQGRVLPQMVYTLWFPERPRTGALDLLGGRLDGVVWRVTFGEDGRPVLYDSMHACGCYHYFFPVAPTRRIPMPEDAQGREGALVLGPGPDLAPGQRVALRLSSGDHQVRAVGLAREAGALETARYALSLDAEIPDRALRLMPVPDAPGRTVSLYGPDGLVAGSERLERFVLWPMGIASAGAMRQWGTHATAFVGRRHFDDMDLLDRAFARPDGARAGQAE